MKQEKDIYLKDEGEFFTVCFQTPIAINLISSLPTNISDMAYGNNYKKIDLTIQYYHFVINWIQKNKLTFETDVDLILN